MRLYFKKKKKATLVVMPATQKVKEKEEDCSLRLAQRESEI
jgi:hypothetical protein